MASDEEIIEAFAEWQRVSNANERLVRMLRGWEKVIVLEATDTGRTYTATVADQQVAGIAVGAAAVADLVVTATSEDLCDLFWGDLNPSAKYVAGEIVLRGSQADVLRLDALSMVAFLGT
jgi:putative sterol carrier protein